MRCVGFSGVAIGCVQGRYHQSRVFDRMTLSEQDGYHETSRVESRMKKSGHVL